MNTGSGGLGRELGPDPGPGWLLGKVPTFKGSLNLVPSHWSMFMPWYIQEGLFCPGRAPCSLSHSPHDGCCSKDLA